MTTSFYRAIWRWHFYAGLVVLPVLAWLAVTGGLYLFKPEIEHALYRDWIVLDAPARPLAFAEMVERVQRASGGSVVQVLRPAESRESWRMTLEMPGGARRTAFVDPSIGRVLGTISEGGLMQTVRNLHSLVIAGPVGNALIEIVAGWAIVLVLTGFILWWPRGGTRAVALRGRPAQRLFWRDLHASTGAIAGAVILFLAVTGLPWSVFWGARLQAFVAEQGLGRPRPPEIVAGSGHHEDPAHRRSLPWSLQAAPEAMSHGMRDVGPDAAIAAVAARGLAPPYALNLPRSPGAAYSLSRTITRSGDARVVTVDAATGQVLQDVSARDFGAGARAIEWGIYTHQGQQYGEPNRMVMLAGCLALLLLAVSAPVMWWKRRRDGRLRAPPAAEDARAVRRVAAAMIVAGILYPLTGLTILAAFAVEWIGAPLRRRSG
ncbi:PepSY domain-containing protein [Sphingomonas parva]|uniref:PepSY domain-containing protein n=1 Tax=Sphingomonas parva TaxID=2555898 RepID=A0A4Y8ZVV7_9SPHN|nr:PepSY domain-containing protein [Sphingomonas parva]TFI59617.1 PepSY domain-containing protein [Sphingomonas parva]